MRRLVIGTIVSLGCVVLTGSSARAQSTVPAPRGVVLQDAPIFVIPDATRTPLRVAAAGTSLELLGAEGRWTTVRFEDPQLGPRVGYLETQYVRADTPVGLRPMDLSLPSASGDRGPMFAAREEYARSVPAPSVPALGRHGWWVNVGLGLGSIGCNDCDGDRYDGFTGQLGVGGTIGSHVQLGVGSDGWARHTAYGKSESLGILDARLRYYPAKRSGFFVTGGVGLGVYQFADEERETGLGILLGVGWDIPVAARVSLTPFWQGYAMANAQMDANVGQFGLGLTIH